LHGVDRVLVLADKERRDIQTDFGPIREEQFTLLRNGFEPDVRSARDAVQRDIAVCVIGRIEARKNQIAILEALEALGVPGVFAGGENPNHAGYCARFRAAIAQSKSEFVEGLSHEQVLALMRRSRVHVSASWFEVSSLVDMEAYFAGCCVVSSLRGGTREILKDSAVYVDPADAKGIREAIAFALEQSGVGVAADEVDRGKDLSALSWGAIGLQLLGIYRAVLQRVQNVELPPGN
jgi:glycosyltransferase involved in cell wall biosynthesis